MRRNSRAWYFTVMLSRAQPPCIKGLCNVDRSTRKVTPRHRYHETAVVSWWVYVSGGGRFCAVYQIVARSVLSTYFIRCAMLRFRPYACWAWALIWAMVHDQLLCAVPSTVLLKVIPSIRMLGTKSTPKSFTVHFHPATARAFDLWILSRTPEAFS